MRSSDFTLFTSLNKMQLVGLQTNILQLGLSMKFAKQFCAKVYLLVAILLQLLLARLQPTQLTRIITLSLFPLMLSLASLSDPLCSYQTMSKAICGSTSRLIIDNDSPFQDKGASVQLTANDIAGNHLAGTNLHFLLERCLMAPGD